ncbi:MAG TPA: hypothetical protein VEX14_06915, partial [Burkholderiaceae bacterium]|nr:hypothetical protein [Burkholderiaceae bacterium]
MRQALSEFNGRRRVQPTPIVTWGCLPVAARRSIGTIATLLRCGRRRLAAHRPGRGGRATFDEASKEGDSKMSMLSNLDLIRRVPLFSMLTVEQAQS